MDGFQTFTTVGLLVTLIITTQNLLRYLRAGDMNGLAGIGLSFASGLLVAVWGAHADVTAGMHLIEGAKPLGDLDGGSLALLGLAIGSVAPFAVDWIKALDKSDSAAKPKLLEAGQGKGGNDAGFVRVGVLLAVIALCAAGLAVAASAPAGAAQCTERRPTVEVKPDTVHVTPGGTATATVKVRNRDGRGCAPTKFLVQAWAYSVGGQPLSVEFVVGSGNYEWPVLKPQQTVHLVLTARANADTEPGVYLGGVGAHDEDGRWEHGNVTDIAAAVG